jgi:multiple sugar transport system substrate-binding protein
MRIVTRRRLLHGSGMALLSAPFLLASAACIPQRGPGASGTTTQASLPVTIYWTAWGGAERIEQYRSQAERFTQANPPIMVQFIPQTGDYNEKVTAMLASSTQLDVARIDAYFMASYVDRGLLLQLDSLMKSDKTFRKDDYFEGAFLDRHQVFDGKIFGMPSGDSPRVVWYNTAAFAKASYPTPNELEAKGQWTVEAYVNALRAVSQGSGDDRVWGGRAYVYGPEMWPFVRMNGGHVLAPDFKSCVIDQPEAVEALQAQVDLEQKLRVAPGPSVQVPGNAFETGRLVTYISGNWDAQSYKLRNFRDWDIAPLPRGARGRFTVHKPNSLTIPAASRYHAQAWKLIRYLVDDLEREYIDSGIFIAFRKDNEEYFLKNFPGPNARWFIEPFRRKEVIPIDLTKHWAEMHRIMVTEMNAAREGKKSVKEAATEIKRQVNVLLSQ